MWYARDFCTKHVSHCIPGLLKRILAADRKLTLTIAYAAYAVPIHFLVCLENLDLEGLARNNCEFQNISVP